MAVVEFIRVAALIFCNILIFYKTDTAPRRFGYLYLFVLTSDYIIYYVLSSEKLVSVTIVNQRFL